MTHETGRACPIADNLYKINEQRIAEGKTSVIACGFTKGCCSYGDETECFPDKLADYYRRRTGRFPSAVTKQE